MKTKCLATALLMVNLVPLHAAELFLLPNGGGKIRANLRDISNDATIAVGSVYDRVTGVPHAAAWRRTATGYKLTVLDDSGNQSSAAAVSADGSVIVGWIYKGRRQVAARWVDGVVELIGETVSPDSQSRAVAVSDDGSVVACNMDRPYWAAVWSQATGVEGLDDRPPISPARSEVNGVTITINNFPYSLATCISGDGRTVGGRWVDSDYTPAIWNATGMVKLSQGSQATSLMNTMSGNGEVMAGYTHIPHPEGNYLFAEATCWDASGGVRLMGHLPGGDFSEITSSSANGEILVGGDRIGNYGVPAIWIKKQNPVRFSRYLKRKYDFDLPSWATGRLCVSPSGRQFGGGAWIIDTLITKNPEISVAQPVRSELKDSSSTKSFGRGEVGMRGLKKTFTIKNTGNADLTGLSVALLGKSASSFEASPLRKKSLPPGASTTFTVVFKPTTSGARTCTLRIKSNDADENPFDVKLSGTGISNK